MHGEYLKKINLLLAPYKTGALTIKANHIFMDYPILTKFLSVNNFTSNFKYTVLN